MMPFADKTLPEKHPRFVIAILKDKKPLFYSLDRNFKEKHNALVLTKELAAGIVKRLSISSTDKFYILPCTYMYVLEYQDTEPGEMKTYWSEEAQRNVTLERATNYFTTRYCEDEEVREIPGYTKVAFKSAYQELVLGREAHFEKVIELFSSIRPSDLTEDKSNEEDEVPSSELEKEVESVLETIRSNHLKVIELNKDDELVSDLTSYTRNAIRDAYLLSSAIHLTSLNELFFESGDRNSYRHARRADSVTLLNLRGDIEDLFSSLNEVDSIHKLDTYIDNLRSSIKEVIFIINRRAKNIRSVFDAFPPHYAVRVN